MLHVANNQSWDKFINGGGQLSSTLLFILKYPGVIMVIPMMGLYNAIPANTKLLYNIFKTSDQRMRRHFGQLSSTLLFILKYPGVIMVIPMMGLYNAIPANTKHLYNIFKTSDQRMRRHFDRKFYSRYVI